jgi:hypothetical protein
MNNDNDFVEHNLHALGVNMAGFDEAVAMDVDDDASDDDDDEGLQDDDVEGEDDDDDDAEEDEERHADVLEGGVADEQGEAIRHAAQAEIVSKKMLNEYE